MPETAQTTQTDKPPLTVLLAAPRGFCAGVTRAIHAVEHALDRFGKPVYVRHEIVHNRRVVRNLADKGAVFISELREAPPDSPVITSAHGIARAVADDARARGLLHIDATCPLVEKVHSEVRRHIARDRQVILVGHRDHPEVTGTLGQAPAGRVLLVETKADCRAVTPDDPARLAWATQTTLSVGDTAEMIRILESRFPEIQGPKKSDICYATENRQNAVAAAAPECELFLVIGSANSSNSQRLVEVARAAGCPRSLRIDGAGELPPPRDLEGVRTLGLTAGASAPEELVREVLDALARDFSLTTEERQVAEERIHFQPPRVLRQNTRAGDGNGDSRGGGEGVGDSDSDGEG
ncbi:MAG: 4-hydroxy-3-methylbut-2-enyl diphosphate reductase, partial [Alphaproteobacteria bacterium]|nr:4-hydroxy-3-methylbut-2-enyl diphosphate reductase [Alphaproteobacteria bacterium]MDA8012908.1 4-hydroxy-3-methylbut-2-enyl diphosphate reductase [Alphaproteobacteria bacterium]